MVAQTGVEVAVGVKGDVLVTHQFWFVAASALA